MIKHPLLHLSLWGLWLLRKFISIDRRTYMLLSARPLQAFLARIGLMRAHAAFLKASNYCPAYQKFLAAEGYKDPGSWSLSRLPIMTKENYVKKYSIEERCYDGKIPATGVVIDESSGSSGVPNNWVRSADEREDVKRILQLNYQLIYRDSGCILLNCFALGPWATGMNVSMSLVDVGILKSIGPDQKKLENTLSMFGSEYRYLVFGYPPFIKSFVDSTALDLSQYKMDLIVGGEGISESLRSYLLKYFRTVISSYGASDLEINIGVETELTISLRRLCLEDKQLGERLFGRQTPPMIFQYNALDYIIETDDTGELLFTIGRQTSAAPKIRYNLKDFGGVMTHSQLASRLRQEGIEIKTLAELQSYFPILYVFGRADLTVPFYGAKVFPSDLEEIINAHPTLVKQINSFQLSSYEDDQINRRLEIHLETVRGFHEELPPTETLRDLFFNGLCLCNQDFREVSRMFDRSCLDIEIHAFETGPFQGRDIRVKNKYIALEQ
ncbi:MAG: phenylacetate--CoA ligase family protein [Pyrinomonadaceae bacterium]